jgi:Ion channel
MDFMSERTVARTDGQTEVLLARRARWASAFRFSVLKMLIAMVLFICSAPFVDQYESGAVISSVFMTLVLITATMAMGSRRWTLVVAVLLVIPALTARWAYHLRPDLVPPEVFSVSSLLFVGFVTVNILYFILRAPQVDSEVLCAGISGYLLIGILFAFAYTLVALLSPTAFAFGPRTPPPHRMEGFTAIYFSYITMCSVGYGDIIPVSPAARMLSMVEAMTGTFYVALMIARLVALHTTRKHND